MAQRRRQAAVIPYRLRGDRVEIALVTSARGKRWVVPKGSVDNGERLRDAALRETEEEAGLRGVLERKPMGRYDFANEHGRFRVNVYLMRVTVVLKQWDEGQHRRREWMTVEDAATRIRPDLRDFVRDVEHRVRRNARETSGKQRATAT